ncbi:MAG: cytochrome c biogenesis protein CcdA [Methanomassiliicoccales archaeon]|nr:MAG: cytochrome c biogenesis protein CcdA [Methanomassiliicoccales archaeon]
MKSKIITFCCLIVLIILIVLPTNYKGQEDTKIRAAFFFSPDCPCTNRSEEILSQLEANYSDFEVYRYNVDIDENWTLVQDFFGAYNVLQEERTDFPFFFIRDNFLVNEKITNVSVSQILDSYQDQDVKLWPDWGDVKWTTCVILFYDSTTSGGLIAYNTIHSLDQTNLQLGIYDIHDSPYNSSLLTLFLEAYDSSNISDDAAVFIGDDLLMDDEITEPNIEALLFEYSGTSTPCKEISELEDTGDICVIVFYSSTCGECFNARKFLREMDAKYPDLNITYYNILEEDNEVLKQSYCEYYDVPLEKRGTLVVFIGDKYFTTVDDLVDGFEEQVKRYEDGVPCTVVNPDEGVVISTFQSFSIITIMAAGLIDGLNPCAFATLIFFISYLSATKRSEKEILIIGISFVLGVFITYLLLGIGILRGIETANEAATVSMIIYPIAGVVAIIFGAYSVYDYTKIKKGKTREMVLKLPKRIKAIIHWIIEKQANLKYFTAFAFFTGMLISIFEFVCTGQVYLPTIIYIMGLPDYKLQAFGYLVLYNLMFIVPLIVIFLAAYFGVSTKRLKAVLKKHVGLIKILTAAMFFVLAVLMIVLTLGMMGLLRP